MSQIIHIMDADRTPEEGLMAVMNCGVAIAFKPIEAHWDDGRTCDECLKAHRDGRHTQKTFAVLDAEDCQPVQRKEVRT